MQERIKEAHSVLAPVRDLKVKQNFLPSLCYSYNAMMFNV